MQHLLASRRDHLPFLVYRLQLQRVCPGRQIEQLPASRPHDEAAIQGLSTPQRLLPNLTVTANDATFDFRYRRLDGEGNAHRSVHPVVVPGFRQRQWQQRPAYRLQRIRLDPVHEPNPTERRGRANIDRTGVDERAVHPYPTVTAAQFAVDADDLSDLPLELREVGPRQLELGGPAPRRFLGGNLGTLELEILECR